MSARRRGGTFRPRRWALLALLAAGLLVVWDLYFPAGAFPPEEKRVIVVERGQSLRTIAANLQREGLLQGTLTFQALARLMRLDRRIKAGQYEFALGTPVPTLLRAFARGMHGLNLVTIPEGLTMKQVHAILARHLGVPVWALDSLARDPAFLDTLGVDAPTLEGYLAPETYEFLPGTPPEVAMRTMVGRTRKILLDAATGRDSLPLGLSLYEILTLASIVECEAMAAVERPRIARVYLNRLESGMKLQADPTVAYGNGMPPRSRLYFRHLRTDSPYNTYLNVGLPPGPICNPGAASIRAVLDPAPPSVRDLYFVADGAGRHMFSRTYEEHLANIARAKSLRARAAALAAADTLAGAAPSSKDSLAAVVDSARAPARGPGGR